MEEPAQPTHSQQALALLCRALSSPSRAESDRRFRVYFDHLLRPELRRFVELRYRFDKKRAAVALQDALSDHMERILMRPTRASELEALLGSSRPVGADQLLNRRFMNWSDEVRLAVTASMGLHALHDRLSPPALEALVKASNRRIEALVLEGASVLERVMSLHGVSLRCFHWKGVTGQSDEDDCDEGDEGDEDAGKPKASGSLAPVGSPSGPLPRDAALAATDSLDRSFRRVMHLDREQRRQIILGRVGQKDLKQCGDADLQGFFMMVGEMLFHLPRVRMPMLGLIYRVVENRATDVARDDARSISLDALVEPDSEGPEEGSDRANDSTWLVAGPSRDPTFEDASAALLMEDMEARIRRFALGRPAVPATNGNAVTGSARKRLSPEEQGDFDVEVFRLETAGCTQEEIAEELDATRDRVRSALGRIAKAIGRERDTRVKNQDGEQPAMDGTGDQA